MASPAQKASRCAFIASMFFFVIGLVLLLTAHKAEVHHTVIPWGGQDTPWMYPWQGYAASFVCFAITAFGIVAGLRVRKN